MSLDTNTAAQLPAPPVGGDEDVLGQATMPLGVGSTFSGTLTNGLHPLVLKDMKAFESDNKFKPGTKRTQIAWIFSVEGREAEGDLVVYTSFSLHEKSKLPGVIQALGKKVPAAGEALKKSNYVGSRTQGFIKNEPGKQDPNKMFPRIKELLAY